MLVLGIETTCDETGCALVKEGTQILSNVIRSQIEIHRPFGGVFPELACRQHIDAFIPVLQEALVSANVQPQDIDLIAVAKGPGLIGALLIGLNAAKALALGWNRPFIGVNHVEAHLYAAMMPPHHPIFPSLGLVISGGHTMLLKMEELGSYHLIGSTRDDAIGEAFDKVASLLGLPYPGGPAIEELSKQGNPTRFLFKAGHVKGRPYDFSFSGLKTNVLYTLKGPNAHKNAPICITQEEKADLAAAFQETALRDVVKKSIGAATEYGCQAIYCGGGVSQNNRLKELFLEYRSPIPIYYPPSPQLSLDNAAMIAGLGFHYYQKQHCGDAFSLSPLTRIPIGQE